jgi:radical SAM superfamily enzyme YgiQ (UPF0313 family)
MTTLYPIAPGQRKPIVVFDMNISVQNVRRPNREFCAVSGAAMYLAAALEKERIATPFFMRTPLVQQEHSNVPFPKKLNAAARPLIFCLSVYDNLFLEIQAEIKALRNAYPEAKIILGGPSVSPCKDLGDLASFFPEADALIKGDGEKVLPALIKALSEGTADKTAISQLGGVYFREGTFVHQNETVNVLSTKELNSSTGVKAWAALVRDIRQSKELKLHTSRSCQYKCIFCSHKYHPYPIYWSAERIVQELKKIKALMEKGKLPAEACRIHFTDDDFFQDRSRAITFLQKVVADSSLREFFSFSFQASAGSLLFEHAPDTELLDLLTKIKVEELHLGTDGFHPKTLRFLIKGGYTWSETQDLIEALHQRNIRQIHFVILTYPLISRETLVQTLENLIRLSQQYGENIDFVINIYLTAYETNRLMPLAKKLGLPQVMADLLGITTVITSADRKERCLPISLPIIEDDRLQQELDDLLFTPLSAIPGMEGEAGELRHVLRATSEETAPLRLLALQHMLGQLTRP